MQTLVSPVRLEGYEALRLRSSSAQVDATFVPSAGMVGASLRDRGRELLHRNGGLQHYVSAGATMGIPLLHPWANRLAGWEYTAAGRRVALDPASPVVRCEEHGLPIHGVVNGSPSWRVVAPAAANGRGPWDMAAELDFAAHPELLAAFPFPHRLRLDVALRGRTLAIRTTLTAGPEGPVPVAFGFHPYLRLPGVPREAWHLELPAMRHLALDERLIPTGASTAMPARAFALGAETFDDGYAGVVAGSRFVLSGGGRRITLRMDEGYRFAQVFAPPTADVVCFEPMTAPANALVSGDGLTLLRPGERHCATFSITVEHA